MKNKVFAILLLSLLSIVSASGQSNDAKYNPVGTWKFEAPYAPEGYTAGYITIGVTEQKYSATMSFAGSDYKIPGEKVRTEKDSLYFSVYLEGQDIRVMMKLESGDKMTGKAVYSEGEVTLSATRNKPEGSN
jgi:hypothetical protein